MNNKKTETKTPAKNPMRAVETIDIDHLENVVGGIGEGGEGGGEGGLGSVEAYPRRMATEV